MVIDYSQVLLKTSSIKRDLAKPVFRDVFTQGDPEKNLTSTPRILKKQRCKAQVYKSEQKAMVRRNPKKSPDYTTERKITLQL